MSLIGYELPAYRADLIINSWEEAAQSGADSPKMVKLLQEDLPWEFADMLQVCLGLKPTASHLQYAVSGRGQRFLAEGFTLAEYYSFFPTDEQLGLTLLEEKEWYPDEELCTIWNPNMVLDILKTHGDIPEAAYINPFQVMSFTSFLQDASSPYTSDTHMLLEGLVLGYPRSASELFIKNNPRLETICTKLELEANLKGVELFDPNIRLYPVGQAVFNTNGAKDRMIAFAKQIDLELDSEFIDYLKGARGANVPGFKFGTWGDLTTHEEAQQTANWQDSGMPQKIASFIQKYNP